MKKKFNRLSCGILNMDNLRDALSCIEEELDFLTRKRVNKSKKPSKKRK